MTSMGSWQSRLTQIGHAAQQWVIEWWRLIYLGALLLVLTLSPSSYSRESRLVLSRHIYLNTAPILLWFTVLCALVTVVLTRIVVVTALSYGLSQYALQVVIRVLVLELIPLTAALFVALRCTIPDGAELTAMQASGQLDEMRRQGGDPVRREVLPRVVAGMFSGITLAALSSVVALVVAYVAVYGFNVSGLAAYTRLFGQVFSPAVTLIFVLKTLFFCLAVALIPMASALYGMRDASVRTSAEMRGLVRMFAVILLIEVTSLVGNYY
ncbi:MAG: ABC transporter permease [Polaromonas sp.]|uniref:MlaE family ABC transporter permease n=1 Tax=Polaromonas sp. TaxID=1869339 RepID=UPI0027346823|nr:ABC transporter permease [Polaromonas sp.]MDP3797719.1 ABC transporter permease [Polaromonas sp.]